MAREVEEMPSLAAIKGLAGIADSDEQLQQATKYCNHAARAEMILRWLLDKPLKGKQLQTKPAFWNLLSHAARLIAPSRLASIVAPLDILGVARYVLHQETLISLQLLQAVADHLNLLFDIAEATNAAPLKSLLSIESQDAAAFVDAWFDTILTRLRTEGFPTLVAKVIDPAFRVWAQHKQHADDNANFAQKCFKSAVSLHASLSPSSVPQKRANKRSRDETDGNIPRSPNAAIERMLARHVFLPARTAFLRDCQLADATSGTALESRISSFELPGLKSLPVPGKEAGEDIAEQSIAAISNLLDIAYRCTPLSAPRQRTRERPWIEAVFHALLSFCLDMQPQARAVAAVSNLLSVVRRPCLLSKDRLLRIHLAYCRGSNNTGVAWDLLAQIAVLQPTIYTDVDRSLRVFDNIFQESSKSSFARDHAKADHITNQVIKPIILAFAETRDLNSFIELWRHELRRDGASRTIVSSTAVQELFSAHVQSTFSHSQLLDMVMSYQKTFNTFAETLAAAETGGGLLFAEMTIFNGVLRGLSDDEVLDGALDSLRSAFYSLSSIAEMSKKNSFDVMTNSPLWSLLARLLSDWFPRWACERDHNTILAEAASIRSSTVLRIATELINEAQSQAQFSAADEQALEFVIVTIVLLPQENVTEEKNDGESLTRPHPGVIANMLICRPHLINVRPDLFSQALEHCAAELYTSTTGSRTLVQQKVEGLVAAAICSHNAQATELLLKTTEDCIAADIEEDQAVMRILLGLLILAQLMPGNTTNDQRRRICSGVAKLRYGGHDNEELNQEIYQRRLSGLMRWVSHTVFGADVSAEERDELYWTAAGISHKGKNLSVVNSFDTLDLLESCLRTVFRHLFPPQGRPASPEQIEQVMATLAKYLERFCAAKHAAFDASLAIAIRAAVSGLRQHTNADRASSLSELRVHKYGDKLLSLLEKCLEKNNDIALILVLDSLSVLKEAPHSSTLAESFQERLKKSTSPLLDQMRSNQETLADESGTSGAILARCFAVECAWSLTTSQQVLATNAASLMARNLTPRDLLLVQSSFRGETQRLLDTDAKVALMDHLQSTKQISSVVWLSVVREVISTFPKDDMEETEKSGPRQMMKTVLAYVVHPETSHQACLCIITILREKAYLLNQYILEAIIAALAASTKLETGIGQQFKDSCRILQIILQQYRSRVQDRMHLLSNLLQSLFGCFATAQLGVQHASLLSRGLQLLCDPPLNRSNSKGGDLVDEARRTRAKVGKFMQYVLHSYCVVVLKSSLSGDVRDALKPGLWAIIAAMETDNADAIKTLSSAMNSSERAILRGTYQDYEAVGKWSGK